MMAGSPELTEGILKLLIPCNFLHRCAQFIAPTKCTTLIVYKY
jgi:hypothetical protein